MSSSPRRARRRLRAGHDRRGLAPDARGTPARRRRLRRGVRRGRLRRRPRGAQTTDETVALCEHAASLGVDGVAVVGPPYYRLDEQELPSHFAAARPRARRCRSTCTSSPRAAATRSPRGRERSARRPPTSPGSRSPTSRTRASSPTCSNGLTVFVGSERLGPSGMVDGAAGRRVRARDGVPGGVAMLASRASETEGPSGARPRPRGAPSSGSHRRSAASTAAACPSRRSCDAPFPARSRPSRRRAGDRLVAKWLVSP